eukprot:GAHX01002142.1.p1 GENE.GAHX01002142.1~~GAHX01002142.1.p1  ORF type:complete len:239 (-),score=42.69 GAHX01002142.1:56-772(-)
MNNNPQELEQPKKLDLAPVTTTATKEDILNILENKETTKQTVKIPSKSPKKPIDLIEAPTTKTNKNKTLNRAISACINLAILIGVITCLFASYMVFRNKSVFNLRNGNFDLYHCKLSARTTRTLMILCLFLALFCNVFSILIELNLFKTVFGVSMVIFFKSTHFYFILHAAFFVISLTSLLSFFFGCGYKKAVYYSAGVWIHVGIVALSLVENVRIYMKYVDIKYDDVNTELLNEEFL